MWHVGVDSIRGYRVFSSVCSLLGNVCCRLVLGSDRLPVYNLPHWSPQQDTTGPLDITGNTHTCPTPLKIKSTVLLLCIFVCNSLFVLLSLLVAVFEL